MTDEEKEEPNIEKLFVCSCGAEALSVEYIPEDEEFYVSIWYLGRRRPLSIRERFRYCWQILLKGEPYGDQIILDKETAKAMKEELEKYIGEMDK